MPEKPPGTSALDLFMNGWKGSATCTYCHDSIIRSTGVEVNGKWFHDEDCAQYYDNMMQERQEVSVTRVYERMGWDANLITSSYNEG